MTRMSLNNSINNYCFSAIFDSSDDSFENYADKKTCRKKSILVEASNPYVNVRTTKKTIEPGITV